MERLTIKTEKGAALKMEDTYLNEDAAKKDLMQRYRIAIDCLAAYEDTGMTPDEIMAAANRRHDCKIDCLLEAHNKLLNEIEQLGGMDRIKEFMQAINDPLTLDELQTMDGEPVWNDTTHQWAIVNTHDRLTINALGRLRPFSDMYYRGKPKEVTE